MNKYPQYTTVPKEELYNMINYYSSARNFPGLARSGTIDDSLIQLPNSQQIFVEHFGWSIPNRAAVDEIKQYIDDDDQVLEVGAGLGLWSSLLQQEEINLIPTDSFITQNTPYIPFAEIEEIDPLDAVRKYNNSTVLMMSFPPYQSLSISDDALRAFDGNKMIFIGKSDNSTGSQIFKKLTGLYFDADDDLQQWNIVRELKLNSPAGMDDKIFFLERIRE